MVMSSTFTKSALVVGAIATSIGLIGRFSPELFLAHLPFPLSIILWDVTGHSVPPYFMTDAWLEIKDWTKAGDAIVSAGAKSGTNWMLYCSHQIRVKGADDDESFTEVMYTTPWMDLRQSRSGTWQDVKEGYNTSVLPDGTLLKDHWDNEKFPFRIFKSHFSPEESGGVLPIKANPQLKFLAMSRDGMDVVNSLVPFWNDHCEKFRQLWGGFPPKSSGVIVEDAEARLKEMLPDGMLRALYFDYVKNWWPLRNEPNVLLLHYADAKTDLVGTVKKIAAFYNVDLNKEELGSVVEKCGLDHMKSVSSKFDYKLPLNQHPPEVWNKAEDTIMKTGTLIRRGENGGHKATFTNEQIQRWRQAEENEFGKDSELLRWARQGGSFS